jgi:hypothetical protein
MTSETPVIQDYAGFVDALVARRKALGFPQLETDERAGLQSGYVGKVEAWLAEKHGRGLGPMSLELLLGALGVGIILVETNSKPEPVRRRYPKRKDDRPEHERIPLFVRLARRRAKKLSPERRSEIARQAALARWRRKHDASIGGSESP